MSQSNPAVQQGYRKAILILLSGSVLAVAGGALAVWRFGQAGAE